MNKYQELMERVTVTPELRRRTLKQVEQGLTKPQPSRLVRFMPLAAAAVLILALLPLGPALLRPMLSTRSNAVTAAAGPAEPSPDPANAQGAAGAPEDAEEALVQENLGEEEAAELEEAALPPEELSSAAELEQRTGLRVPELTQLPFEPELVTYTAWSDGLAQIVYEGSGYSLCWRVSAGTEDNSGDYNSYAWEERLTLAGHSVTVKRDTDRIALALWNVDGQSFSLAAEPGLTRAELEAIVLRACRGTNAEND